MFNQYGLLMKSDESGTPYTIKDPEFGRFLYDLYTECGADLTGELNDWCLAGSDSSSCFYMAFDYGRKSYTGKGEHILPTYGIRGTDAAGRKYVNQYFQKYEDILDGAFVDYVFGTDYISAEELPKSNLENETVERLRQKLWGISHMVEKPDLVCRIMERIWAAKENDPETRILLILKNAGEESLNLLRQLYLLLPQGLRVQNGFETNIRREDLEEIARDNLPVSIVTADKTYAAELNEGYLKGLRFPVEKIEVDAASTLPCDLERVGRLKHHCERMSVVTEHYLNYAEWTAMDQAGLTQSSFGIYGRIWELREELYSGKNQEAAAFSGIPGQKQEESGKGSQGKQGSTFEVLVPKREMDELNEKYISMKRGKTRAAAARNILGILAAVCAAAGAAVAVIFGTKIRTIQDDYTVQEEKLQNQEEKAADLSRQLEEKESEAADLSRQLVERESEAENLSKQLEAGKSETANLSQQLGEKESEAESLSQQLAQKESEAADLSQQLEGHEETATNLSDLSQQLAQKESEVKSLSQQLGEKESEAESLSQQLDEKESEAASLSQRLESRESKEADLSQQLAQKESEAESLSKQLDEKESEAESLSQQLAQRESKEADLSQQLGEKESEAENLSQQLAQRESEAKSLSQQLDEKESEAESLSQQLAQRESEAADLSQQLKDRELEAASLSQQLEEERSRNEELPAETNPGTEVQTEGQTAEAVTEPQTETEPPTEPQTELPAEPQTEPYVPLGILY